jgi:hypothetical protein
LVDDVDLAVRVALHSPSLVLQTTTHRKETRENRS